MGHKDPSEVVVHLGDGVPESVALEVMGDSVTGALVGDRAAEAAGGMGLDAKPGVGDPGIAPGAKYGESTRGGHLGGDFARVLEAFEEVWAGEVVRWGDELIDTAEDIERE